MTTAHTDAETLIIGGGLAGTLLARALLARGHDPAGLTLLHDPADAGASTLHGALLHAFPGRRINPREPQMSAFTESLQTLTTLGEQVPGAVARRGVLRPLVEAVHTDALIESARKAEADPTRPWPDAILPDGVRTLDAATVRALEPALVEAPALHYAPGLVTRLDHIRAHLHDTLRTAGVTLHASRAETLTPPSRTAAPWHIHSADPNVGRLTAARVVLAAGAGLRALLPALDVRATGGASAILEPNAPLQHLVSYRGYLATRPDDLWVCGATITRLDTGHRVTDMPAQDHEAALREVLARILPDAAHARMLELWRGVRAIYPDRRPLVGPAPHHPRLYLLGAFGARGTFWIPFSARTLADHLTDGTPVHPYLAADRVRRAHRWTLPR